MLKLVPSFYAEYGRDIDSFRAIPLNIDCLKLVERRSLIALNSIGKKTKSVNAIGKILLTHPHGDASIYGVLDKQIYQGRAIPYGSFSSLGKEKTRPAAMRYTSIEINKKTCGSAFKYINDVPHDNFDFADEALFLADCIPLGLVGRDVTQGIGFHKTIIPKYTKSDLAKRLKWLLTKDSNLEMEEPIIIPQFNDCVPKENTTNAFQQILNSGIGNIRVIPNGQIDNKSNTIYVQGKDTHSSFSSLIMYCNENKIKITDMSCKDINNNDMGPYFINLKLDIPKKLITTNIQDLFKEIWKKFLIKNINFKCYFVDFQSKKVILQGIDQVLLNNYKYYNHIVYFNKYKKFKKLMETYYTNNIIIEIKNILNSVNINNINDILKLNTNKQILLERLDEHQKYIQYNKQITNEDMEECISNNTIKKLINITVDISSTIQDIIQCKQDISNIKTECFNEVCNSITN